jgi:3-oxoacyl-[acyl-carrier-protein] synthase-3
MSLRIRYPAPPLLSRTLRSVTRMLTPHTMDAHDGHSMDDRRGVHLGDQGDVVIRAIRYEVGECVPLCDLVGEGLSPEEASQLLDQQIVGVSVLKRPLAQAMEVCIRESVQSAGIAAADIDTVILATESFEALFEDDGPSAVGAFRNTRNRLFLLLQRLGICRASVLCATYGACTNLLHAFIMAEALVTKGLSRNVLIVAGEKFGAPGARLLPEAVSMAGDGAAACIVSSEAPREDGDFRLAYVGTRPYKQVDDSTKMLLEMFRAMRNAAADCYEACNLQPADFRWIVVGDYNTLTSVTHGKLLGFPPDRIFLKNVGQLGHIPFDPLINLANLTREQLIATTDRVLLFLCGPVYCGAIALEAI